MTAASITLASPSAQGGAIATGRNIYAVGNRMVGKFRLTFADLYATGGTAVDFAAQGFTYPIAEVAFTPHVTVANVLLTRYFPSYDFVNKKVMIFDTVDGDEPNTDDLTGLVFDVTVTSE